MKKRLTKTLTLLVLICVTTIVKAQVPSASGFIISDITQNFAKATATITANGSSTTVTFQYATNDQMINAVSVNSSSVNGGTTSARAAFFSNLSPNTQYWWRVNISNNSGGGLATIQTFTTLPASLTISSISASNLNRTSARINYTISSAIAFTTNVRYGTDVNNLTNVIAGTVGTGSNIACLANLTGLTTNTTYHYQVEGVNADGTITSSKSSFNTAQLTTVSQFNFDGTKTNTGATLTFGAGANTYVTDRNLQPNKAIQFANNPISVNIPALPVANQSRTISIWAKVDSYVLNNENYIFGYGNASSLQGYGLLISHNNIFGTSYQAIHTAKGDFSNNVNSSQLLSNPFGWHHYVTSFDGTTAKLYVDGVLMGSGNRPTWNTATSDFFLGGNATGNTNFTGAIDDLNIFNQSLTDAEVANLYVYNSLTPSARPIVSNFMIGSVATITTAAITYKVSSVEAFTTNIKYGTDANNLNNTVVGLASIGNLKDGTTNLTGLNANTTYYYQVESTNVNGSTSSAILSFTTNELNIVTKFNFNNTKTSTNGSLTFSDGTQTFVNDRNAIPNGALQFTEIAVSVIIPSLPIGNSARTVSIWAKIDTYVNNNYNYIFGYGANVASRAYGVAVFKSATGFSFHNYAFADDLSTTDSPFATSTDWHHYVSTFDGTTATLFVDGISVASANKSAWNTFSTIFVLGGSSVGPINFTGAVDDLVIFDKALTAQEVTNLFNNNSILPVTLISYTAKAQNNNAVLNWKTASETNNSHFVIAKSTDGTNFSELAKINAKSANGADYTYTDNNTASGTNYYRLTQVDLDGKTTNLGVKAVNMSLSTDEVKAYPNPATDVVNISFEAGIYAKATLLDINGKVISTSSIAKVQNIATIDLSKVAPGTYLIQLTGKNSKTIRKVIKR